MPAANNRLHAPPSHLQWIEITNDGETALAAGSIHLEGALVGVPYEQIAAGETGLLIIGAKAPGMSLPKAKATAVTKGAAVFVDTGEGQVTVDGADRFLGFAVAAATGEGVTGDDFVQVRFAPTYPYPEPTGE